MRIPVLLPVLLASLPVSLVAAPAAATAKDAAMPKAAAAYVKVAGASDLFEIESSRIALKKSKQEDVRSFATMMVDHHSKTTQTLVAAAREAGMTPAPPTLMPEQKGMIQALEAAPAAAFDKLYLSQQVTAHRKALALHKNYADKGDAAPLRKAAAAAVPIVQQHHDRVTQLAR